MKLEDKEVKGKAEHMALHVESVRQKLLSLDGGKGKQVVGSTSEAQHEPEAQNFEAL
ncbi:hypothetical protein A2U01_0116253 [Trifolium medium]|uniref:Uncharacterized protein n=1 Tax=Trifolium medium TaxID=97028 RepID=A0A392W7T1_9FABA|nr:hypothetical protein [Trifolium medium]